jgi:hypothetical protein
MLQVGKLAILLLVPLLLVTILAVLLLGSQFVGTQQSTSVAQAALTLQDHIFGERANQYNADDPFMQPIISYWRSYCHNADGSLCSLAQSGNLQCVEFVSAAQWLAGDPLPKIDDAINFWTDYTQQPGWAAIPSPSEYPNLPFEPPNVGDLMIWRDDGPGAGHIAIVVDYQAPTPTQNGTITVAEGNAPGNRWQPFPSPLPGNTYTMMVYPNGVVDTWPGYVVVGFLHHFAASTGLTASSNAQTLPVGLSFSTPYVKEAWDDALQAAIPPGFFVRQIQQESGFHLNAVSPAGAVGIAQFMPGTARGLGIDPWDPHASLQAAAQLMATYQQEYGGDYAKALAAYNGGPEEVIQAEARAAQAGQPSSWMNYLVLETRQYIRAILGI